jgi:hypothetical protein
MVSRHYALVANRGASATVTFTTAAKLSDDLRLSVPKEYRQALTLLLDRSAKKHNGYVTVTLGTPKRPRTTGPRSQNSWVWGACQSIAGQLDAEADRVYQAMKRMAVTEGYPTRYNPVDGVEEPESQRRVSVEQDAILIKVIQRFADENSLTLVEYVDGIPTETVGGTRKTYS